MSFRTLSVDELRSVAEFFVVDVEAANAETGPNKKELLAALASGEEPVTWEQYNDIYLAAKARETAAVTPAPVVENVVVEPVVVDTSNYVLVKMERQNPTFEVRGHTFKKKHPFASMAPEDAEYVVKNIEGFRLALPTEVADYYN